MQLNADIVPIPSLYFESGSKRWQPEKEYSGLYGTFSIVNWSYSIYLDNIHSILAKRVYFMVLSLTPCGHNIKVPKIYSYDVIIMNSMRELIYI